MKSKKYLWSTLLYHSVIIPSFNRKYCIARAIDSVLSQTRLPDEILIVDDGSTDGTYLYLQETYQNHPLSSRIFIFKTENKGVSAARNFAIQQSKINDVDHYFHFLDSDDEWLNHKIEMQESFLLAHPQIKLVHGEEIWIRNSVRVNPMKKHKKFGGRIFIPSLALCLISPSAVCIHQSIFKEIGNFDESFIVCEDYELWLRICSRMEVGFLETAMIKKYGGHEDQLSKKYIAMDYWRIKAMFQHIDSPFINAEERQSLKEQILKKSEILCKAYIKHNNMQNYEEIHGIFLECKNRL